MDFVTHAWLLRCTPNAVRNANSWLFAVVQPFTRRPSQKYDGYAKFTNRDSSRLHFALGSMVVIRQNNYRINWRDSEISSVAESRNKDWHSVHSSKEGYCLLSRVHFKPLYRTRASKCHFDEERETVFHEGTILILSPRLLNWLVHSPFSIFFSSSYFFSLMIILKSKYAQLGFFANKLTHIAYHIYCMSIKKIKHLRCRKEEIHKINRKITAKKFFEYQSCRNRFIPLFNNNLFEKPTHLSRRVYHCHLGAQVFGVWVNERTYNVVHRDPNEIQATLSLDNPTEC